MRQAWKYIKNNNTKRVVLNTAQGSMIRNLCLFGLFSKIEFVGIIHTLLKTHDSFTQKVISWKVKKYFILSKFLLNKVEPKKGLSYDYFYPLIFSNEHQPKDQNGLIITIIGGVEKRRKDLDGFVQMIQQEQDGHYYFLGKSNANDPDVRQFKEELMAKGLENRVSLFNEYVSQDEFTEVLNKTDFILPLVHPNTPSSAEYFRNQITGAMTVSFGYKTPMLIHEEYQQIDEMKSASFYYSMDDYADKLKEFILNRNQKVEEMKLNPEYSEITQMERYMNFLLN